MKIKNTLILIGIFIVLLIFYYVYEVQGGKKREEAKELASTLLPLKQEDVVKVSLKQKNGETVTYERKDKTWQISEPLVTEGDNSAIDQNVSSFLGAKIERTIATSLTDLSKYGLDLPRATVAIHLKDSSKYELLVGDENPTGSFVFVKFKDKPEIYTTAKSIYTAASKNLFNLRDKKIAHFERDEVRKMEIKRDKEKLVFEKADDKWMIREPVEFPLKQWEVNGILSSLENSKAKKFEDEEPDDLDRYGLLYPAFEVHLYLGESLSEVVFTVGDSSDYKDQFYAKESSRKPVITIDRNIVQKLRKKLFDFQDRKLLSFRNDEVRKIHYKSEEEDFIVEKMDTTGWYLTAGDTIPASENNMTGWLNRIRNLTTDELVTYHPGPMKTYGLEPVQILVEIFGENDASLGKIMVGYKAGEKYFIRNDKYNYVYKIKEDKIKGIMKKGEDLKQINEESPNL